MDDTEDLSNRKFRQTREVDQGLRQFLKLETGLGNSAAFQRGHVWNFEWCSEDPAKAKPKNVERVHAMMNQGYTFDEAFDYVSRMFPLGACCGCSCGRCEHQGGENKHTEACSTAFHGA